MAFDRRTIKVDGQEVELDVNADLPIGDISHDMDKVAASMAWWASVWAAAEAEKIKADAYYRAWRAAQADAALATDPKMAEWKVKNFIESRPEFVEWKDRLAKAEENAILARAVYDAFSKKGNMLQSRGAMARDINGASGMSTPSERPPARRNAPTASEADAEADRSRPMSDKEMEELFEDAPARAAAQPEAVSEKTAKTIDRMKDINRQKKQKPKGEKNGD